MFIETDSNIPGSNVDTSTMALHLNRMQAKSINFETSVEIRSSDIIIIYIGLDFSKTIEA